MLPFYRPVQTGFSQFSVKTGEQGIKVQTHAMLMAGGVEFNIPEGVKAEFARLVECYHEVKAICYEATMSYPVCEELLPA